MIINLTNRANLKTRYWRIPSTIWAQVSEGIAVPKASALLKDIIEKYEIGEPEWNIAIKFQIISMSRNIGKGPYLEAFQDLVKEPTSKFNTGTALYAKSTDLTIVGVPLIFKPYIYKFTNF